MRKHKTDKEFIPGKGFTREDWDAVDSPPATDEQLAQAVPFAEAFPEFAAEIKKNLGGRPKSDNPKVSLSIRLDREVVDRFKADGDGWQSRMNETLRKAVGL